MIKKIILISLCTIVLVALAGRALLSYYGLEVTSWYRTPMKNAEVEGKMFSLHLIGWAYDVVPINSLLHAVRNIWPFKYVVESDHIHLQIF